MKFTARNINMFLLLKLPIAWLAGVRLINISSTQAKATASLKWLNQNPFKSMYFAVQAMAAELSTGVLVMREIKFSQQPISMLVIRNTSEFHKKAKGRIVFICEDGHLVKDAVQKSISTGEGQNIWMSVKAFDESETCVSEFKFNWSIKLKS